MNERSFATLRDEIPVHRQAIYMNYAAVAPMSSTVRTCVAGYLQARGALVNRR